MIKRIMFFKQQNPKLAAFGIGFLVGSLGVSLYLACAGDYYPFFAPLWARIAFFPGFVVGSWFHETVFASRELAIALGCLTVGISYGLLFLLGFQLKKTLFPRKATAESGDLPEDTVKTPNKV